MACALNQAQAMALRNRPVGPGMDLARPRSLHARRLATTKLCIRASSTVGQLVNKDAARKQQSLFAKLGGAPAVNAAVELFYDKMLADPRISYFFDGIDMRKQRAHQAAFLTYAMGGSKKYEGNANMNTAHARLAREMDMRMEHFDIVVEHLGASLQDLNVPQDDISEAAELMETLRPAFQEAIDDAHK